MKKIIILMLALATSAAYADTSSDAIRGAIIGAIIGNNIGDGDSKSGAVIGAISGVIAGSKHYNRRCGQDYHIQQHTRNYYHNIRSSGCNCNVRTVRIEERYWIPEKIVRDTCGNVLYYEPGRYETTYRFRNVPVCR